MLNKIGVAEIVVYKYREEIRGNSAIRTRPASISRQKRSHITGCHSSCYLIVGF